MGVRTLVDGQELVFLLGKGNKLLRLFVGWGEGLLDNNCVVELASTLCRTWKR